MQVLGSSDKNRQFHGRIIAVGPSETAMFYEDVLRVLADRGYSPNVILADGSAAITKAVKAVFPHAKRAMCYAHLDRQVRKRLRGLPERLRTAILSDIELLRYARTEREFERRKKTSQHALFHPTRSVSGGMLSSWPRAARDFADYFRKTWLDSDLGLWFEAATGHCSTNNGLERENRFLKDNFSLRRKLPFADYLSLMLKVVRYWTGLPSVSGHYSHSHSYSGFLADSLRRTAL